MSSTNTSRSKSPRPVLADQIDHWDFEADVAIVGMGIAGVSAALGAKEITEDVLVVERSGGPAGYCGGIVYLGGGTPMQRAMGYEDSAEEMYTFLTAALGPAMNEAKLRLYCDQSVEHYEWLVSCGVQFVTGPDADDAPIATRDKEGRLFFGGAEYGGGGLLWTGGEQAYPFNQVAKPAPRGHMPRGEGDIELLYEGAVLKSMMGALDRAGVQVVPYTTAERLVVDSHGCVVGVDASSVDGPVRIRARKGVIITTGGFISNDEMLRKHAPCALGVGKIGHEYQDGLGIAIGQSAGAETIHMDALDASLAFSEVLAYRKGIVVNCTGLRFMNEDTYFGRLGTEVVAHQGAACYLVLDDEIFEPNGYLKPASVADSLEEVEAAIGFPAGSLVNTVTYYNEFAGKGQDPLFRKAPEWLKALRPPFGVVDLTDKETMVPTITLGGLSTDELGRALDAGGAPIKGLYAAGRATSGLAVHGYCSGISLGDGSFFGRRAGRAAAESAR